MKKVLNYFFLSVLILACFITLSFAGAGLEMTKNKTLSSNTSYNKNSEHGIRVTGTKDVTLNLNKKTLNVHNNGSKSNQSYSGIFVMGKNNDAAHYSGHTLTVKNGTISSKDNGRYGISGFGNIKFNNVHFTDSGSYYGVGIGCDGAWFSMENGSYLGTSILWTGWGGAIYFKGSTAKVGSIVISDLTSVNVEIKEKSTVKIYNNRNTVYLIERGGKILRPNPDAAITNYGQNKAQFKINNATLYIYNISSGKSAFYIHNGANRVQFSNNATLKLEGNKSGVGFNGYGHGDSYKNVSISYSNFNLEVFSFNKGVDDLDINKSFSSVKSHNNSIGIDLSKHAITSGNITVSNNTTGIQNGKISGGKVTANGNNTGITGTVIQTGAKVYLSGNKKAAITDASITGGYVETSSHKNMAGVIKTNISGGEVNSYSNGTGVDLTNKYIQNATVKVSNNSTGIINGEIKSGSNIYTFQKTTGNTGVGIYKSKISGGNIYAYYNGGSGLNGVTVSSGAIIYSGSNGKASDTKPGFYACDIANGTLYTYMKGTTKGNTGHGISASTIRGNANVIAANNTANSGIASSTININNNGKINVTNNGTGINSCKIENGEIYSYNNSGVGVYKTNIENGNIISYDNDGSGLNGVTISKGTVNSYLNGNTNQRKDGFYGSDIKGGNIYTYNSKKEGNTNHGISASTIRNDAKITAAHNYKSGIAASSISLGTNGFLNSNDNTYGVICSTITLGKVNVKNNKEYGISSSKINGGNITVTNNGKKGVVSSIINTGAFIMSYNNYEVSSSNNPTLDTGNNGFQEIGDDSSESTNSSDGYKYTATIANEVKINSIYAVEKGKESKIYIDSNSEIIFNSVTKKVSLKRNGIIVDIEDYLKGSTNNGISDDIIMEISNAGNIKTTKITGNNEKNLNDLSVIKNEIDSNITFKFGNVVTANDYLNVEITSITASYIDAGKIKYIDIDENSILRIEEGSVYFFKINDDETEVKTKINSVLKGITDNKYNTDLEINLNTGYMTAKTTIDGKDVICQNLSAGIIDVIGNEDDSSGSFDFSNTAKVGEKVTIDSIYALEKVNGNKKYLSSNSKILVTTMPDNGTRKISLVEGDSSVEIESTLKGTILSNDDALIEISTESGDIMVKAEDKILYDLSIEEQDSEDSEDVTFMLGSSITASIGEEITINSIYAKEKGNESNKILVDKNASILVNPDNSEIYLIINNDNNVMISSYTILPVLIGTTSYEGIGYNVNLEINLTKEKDEDEKEKVTECEIVIKSMETIVGGEFLNKEISDFSGTPINILEQGEEAENVKAEYFYSGLIGDNSVKISSICALEKNTGKEINLDNNCNIVIDSNSIVYLYDGKTETPIEIKKELTGIGMVTDKEGNVIENNKEIVLTISVKKDILPVEIEDGKTVEQEMWKGNINARAGNTEITELSAIDIDVRLYEDALESNQSVTDNISNSETINDDTTDIIISVTGTAKDGAGFYDCNIDGGVVYTYYHDNKKDGESGNKYGILLSTINGGEIYSGYNNAKDGGIGIAGSTILKGTLYVHNNIVGIGKINNTKSNIKGGILYAYSNTNSGISDSIINGTAKIYTYKGTKGNDDTEAVGIKDSHLSSANTIYVKYNYIGIKGGTIDVSSDVLHIENNTIGIDSSTINKYVIVKGKGKTNGVVGIQNSFISKGAEVYDTDTAFNSVTIIGGEIYTFDTKQIKNNANNYGINGSNIIGGTVEAAYNTIGILGTTISTGTVGTKVSTPTVYAYKNLNGIEDSYITGGNVWTCFENNGNTNYGIVGEKGEENSFSSNIEGGNIHANYNRVGISKNKVTGGTIEVAHNNDIGIIECYIEGSTTDVSYNGNSGISNSSIKGGIIKIHNNTNDGVVDTTISGGSVLSYENGTHLNENYPGAWDTGIDVDGFNNCTITGGTVTAHNNSSQGFTLCSISNGVIYSYDNDDYGLWLGSIEGGTIHSYNNGKRDEEVNELYDHSSGGLAGLKITGENTIIYSTHNKVGIAGGTIEKGTINSWDNEYGIGYYRFQKSTEVYGYTKITGGTIDLKDNTNRSIKGATVSNSTITIRVTEVSDAKNTNNIGLKYDDANIFNTGNNIKITGFEVGIAGSSGTIKGNTIKAFKNINGIKLDNAVALLEHWNILNLDNTLLISSANSNNGMFVTGNGTEIIIDSYAIVGAVAMKNSTLAIVYNEDAGIKVNDNALLEIRNIKDDFNSNKNVISVSSNTIGLEAINSGTINIIGSSMTLKDNTTTIKATDYGVINISAAIVADKIVPSTITITGTKVSSGIVAEGTGYVNITLSNIYISSVSVVGIYGADIYDSYVKITNKNKKGIGAININKKGLYGLILQGNNIGLKTENAIETEISGGYLTITDNETGIKAMGEKVININNTTIELSSNTIGIEGKEVENGKNIILESVPVLHVGNNSLVGIKNAKLKGVGSAECIVEHNKTGLEEVEINRSYMTISSNTTGISNSKIESSYLGLSNNSEVSIANSDITDSDITIFSAGNYGLKYTNGGDRIYKIYESNLIIKNTKVASLIDSSEVILEGSCSGSDLKLENNERGFVLKNDSNLILDKQSISVSSSSLVEFENGVNNLSLQYSTVKIDSGTYPLIKAIEGAGSSTAVTKIEIRTTTMTFYDDKITEGYKLFESSSTNAFDIDVKASEIIGQITSKGEIKLGLKDGSRWKNMGNSKINKLESQNGDNYIVLVAKGGNVSNLTVTNEFIGNLKLDVDNLGYTADAGSILAVKLENAIVTGEITTDGEIDLGAYNYSLDQVNKNYYLKRGSKSNTAKLASKVPGITNAVVTAGLNSLTRRLGDIRRTPEEKLNGVWTRVYGRNDKFTKEIETKMEMTGAEGGYDRRVMKDKKDRYYIGAMVGYQNINKIETKKKTVGTKQNGEGTAPSVGVYGTWIAENGLFADITVRNFWISLDMNETIKGCKPYRSQVAVSGEFGKEFEVYSGNSTKVVIEPKTEWVYSYAGSASSKQLEYGATNSIKGKVGFMLGLNAQTTGGINWQPYMEAGYSYEFDNKTEVRYLGNAMGEQDLSGGYGDVGVGLNVYLGKGFSGYSLVSYEKGSDQENFVYNVGFRYGF